MSIRQNSFKGINLLDALRLARQWGCLVQPRRGTGALFIFHPHREWRILISGHRLSCPRHFSSKLGQLFREGFGKQGELA